MLRISQIKLPVNGDSPEKVREQLLRKAALTLGLRTEEIKTFTVSKRSVDARHKDDIKYVYTVLAEVSGEREKRLLRKKLPANVEHADPVRYRLPACGQKTLKNPPVIAGSGPAGLFCAYILALKGFSPVVIERGADVDERTAAVGEFFAGGKLLCETNVQFGEGGAGTFSDGKLNTLVKDKCGRNRMVLETFVNFGAKESILYDNKPHIGTDVLKDVVKNMRKKIEELGGTFRFKTCVTDIVTDGAKLTGVIVNGGEKIDCEVFVAAIGHSARDTFRMFFERGLLMEAKAFAVGVRVQHKQSFINRAMYGVDSHAYLEAAEYKLTHTTKKNRGVYSFCMCPGGYVVNAASEEKMTAVNGMSYSARDGENANSAIVVTVTPDDYGGEDALSGIEFQRKLEKRAFEAGAGKIPVQTFADYEADRVSTGLGEVVPQMKGGYALANLRPIFPEFINDSIIEGMHSFSKKIKNFDMGGCVLAAVESRTSSPVRIGRDENFEANFKGFFPCGEGAGYAGGITSAAMDGLRVGENIISRFGPGTQV